MAGVNQTRPFWWAKGRVGVQGPFSPFRHRIVRLRALRAYGMFCREHRAYPIAVELGVSHTRATVLIANGRRVVQAALRQGWRCQG